MSEPKNIKVLTKVVLKSPKNMPNVVLKNNKYVIVNGKNSNEMVLKNFNIPKGSQVMPLFKEDVIYESKTADLFKGPPHSKLTITNRLNVLKNNSRTTAVISHHQGAVLQEKSSDKLVELIGQENYDLVFSALCSVINQETKIRGIMALLTENVAEQTCLTNQTEAKCQTQDKCSQTDENSMVQIYRMKQRLHIKSRRYRPTPYVVKDVPKKVKKLIVDPYAKRSKAKSIRDKSPEKDAVERKKIKIEFEEDDLPLIHLSEDSNLSTFSNITNISNDMLLDNPKQLLSTITEHTITEKTYIKMLDGTHVVVPVKPEDKFHYATPKILQSLNEMDRKKLLMYQAYIDWKYCLERDVDGQLPIHTAVINNDIDMLRRQCLMLKNRQESLDLTVNTLTPLNIAIQQHNPLCTSMLLQHGADPLLTDEDHKTALHLAAENSCDHLKTVVDYCRLNARSIFDCHTELWDTKYEIYSEQELGAALLHQMCIMSDGKGYTPLMLASKLGKHSNVELLVEASPKSINMTMPNCGNTALFLAVGEAIIDATNRSNQNSVSEIFRKTISVLIQKGADVMIANHAGGNIVALVQDSSNSELATLISSQVVYYNMEKCQPGTSKDYTPGKVMLLKDDFGNIDVTEINTKNNGTSKKSVESDASNVESDSSKVESDDSASKKPIIIQNIPIKTYKTIQIDSGKIIHPNDILTVNKPNNISEFLNVNSRGVGNNERDGMKVVRTYKRKSVAGAGSGEKKAK